MLPRLRQAMIPALVATIIAGGPAVALGAGPERIPGQLIVAYEPGATTAAEDRAVTEVAGRAVGDIGRDIEVVRVARGSEAAALAELRANPAVRYAAQDGIVRAQVLPDDLLFPLEYGLLNTGQSISGLGEGTADADIDADLAWDIRTTGSAVAIVDSGVDFSHPDLTCNRWTNPGEVGGGKETNLIDDDANGYVDDWKGWDFVEGNNDPTDDVDGHGSHVAGTVAACANNGIGVAGVAWSAPLMAVRVLGDDGTGEWSGVIAGFSYAGKMGARVANGSLGGGVIDGELIDIFRDQFQAWPNTLFVLAAGNSNANLDASIYAPCEASASAGNAICVQANDNKDAKASYSNHGANATISAPGSSVASICATTTPLCVSEGWSYAYASGTSMAAPHVAGAASLVAAEKPSLSGARMRALLEDTADVAPALTLVPGNRRLNANTALARAADNTPPATFALTAPAAGAVLTGPPTVSWQSTSDPSGIDSYEVLIDSAIAATVPASTTSWTASSVAAGAHTVAVRATDLAGNQRTTAARSFTVQGGPVASAGPEPPAGGGAPLAPALPSPAAPEAVPMVLAVRGSQPVRLRASRGYVSVPMQCIGPASRPCAMTVNLRHLVGRTGTRAAATMGTLAVSVPGGWSGTKRLRLNAYALRLLRAQASVAARMTTTPRAGATDATTVRRVRVTRG